LAGDRAVLQIPASGASQMKSPKPTKSPVVKRSVRIDGRNTSVSLEDQFWEALKEIAKERGMALQDLVAAIKAERRKGGLSSAIRVFVIEHYGARTPRA
jgi:predicted DNA-binding ribbon-helix-helix protein